MNARSCFKGLLTLSLVLFWGTAYAQSPKVDPDSVTRVDPVADLDVSDSRHNLGNLTNHVGTVSTDEVCVFCHTPHFSNTDAPDAPLWNRNISAGPFIPYSSATMDTVPGQPDAGSIACLSCHDGTVAFDSLINAPGPKGVTGYTVGSTPNSTFTNNPSFSLGWTFTEDDGAGGVVTFAPPATMITLGSARLLIGTDLSNDHPISMVYPTAAQDPAFNQPIGTAGSAREFVNGIRTFEADKLQCASCHEPHLGDTAAAAKGLRPFLRVANTGSAVCLTCHIK